MPSSRDRLTPPLPSSRDISGFSDKLGLTGLTIGATVFYTGNCYYLYMRLHHMFTCQTLNNVSLYS